VATQPVFSEAPRPQLLSKPFRPSDRWTWTRRTTVLFLLLLVVAVVADYYDDSYLIVDHPVVLGSPQDSGGSWPAASAQAIRFSMRQSPGAEGSGNDDSPYGRGILGGASAHGPKKPKAGAGVWGGGTDSAIDSAFGAPPY